MQVSRASLVWGACPALFLVAALVASMLAPAAGHPSLFVSGRATSCLSMPNQGYAAHGPPQPDPSIAIQLTDASSNQAVAPGAALCPGGTYNLQVTWGAQQREYLITASHGTFTAVDPLQDPANCNNRMFTVEDYAVTPSASSPLVLPCADAMSDGTLQIRVTTAQNSSANYATASATYPIDSTCSTGSCGSSNPQPAASPLPSPSPSQPPPSTPSCPTSWPDSRLSALCQQGSGNSVAQAPACTIYRQCTGAADYPPLPQVCNTTRMFASLCIDFGSDIPECASASAQAGGNLLPCIQSLAFALPSASALSRSVRAMCAEPGMGDMNGCSECTSTANCPDPFDALSKACVDMQMSQCSDWSNFCASDAAIDGNVGVAAPGLCIPETQRADVAAQYPAPPRTSPPPPSSPPPSPSVSPLSSPSQPPSSTPSCPTSWPVSRLAALCQQGSGNNVARAPACTIYRQCTGAADYPPLPQLCNATRIFASLCMDFGSDIPECASAATQAGGDLTPCIQSSSFALPSADVLSSEVLAMCAEPGMGDMNGCSECTSAANCPDPLDAISKVCVDMQMSQCSDWLFFCSSDAAIGGNVGVAAPSLCIPETQRADVAAQYAPPPGAVPPFSSPSQPPSCPTSWPVSRLAALCQQGNGNNVAQAPACTIYRQCTATGGYPPLPQLCNTTRMFASLCMQFESDIPECTSAAAQAGGDLLPCIQSLAFALPSASVLSDDLLSVCSEPGMGDVSGCSDCTSAANCPDPLSAMSKMCLDVPIDQCAYWSMFCSSDAAISGNMGVAAPSLCIPESQRAQVAAQYPAQYQPPPGTSTPTAPSPSQASPRSPAPSPSASPSPASVNCLRSPSSPACANYTYPDTSVQQDIASLCRSMPGMTGCSIYNACKAQDGASGVFCQPFTLLATMCVDMPTMTACSSYLALCNTTGSVVRQCAQQQPIPSAMGSTDTLNTVISICTEMSMTDCSQCVQPFTSAACPDPLFTLSALCITMPTMAQCDPYFTMCAAASSYAQAANQAASSTTSSLSRFCDASLTGPSGGPVFLSRTYLPAMLNYFHQRTEEVVLWMEWVPTTQGQYAGTCIAVIMMGVVSVLLKSLRSGLSLRWSFKESTRTAVPGLRNAAMSSSSVPLGSGVGEVGPGTMSTVSPGHIGLQVMTELEVHVTGQWWWLCTGRQAWQTLVKSLLFGLSITLDYMNMLVAMTFNIGLFVAVVGGYLLGSLLFTPVLENYAMRLQQRKQQHRSSLLPSFQATLMAADAAAAKDAAGKGLVAPDSSSTPESMPANPGYAVAQQEGGECCCTADSENPMCCP